MPTNLFSKIWEAVLTQIEAIEGLLYEAVQKVGMGGLTTGLVMLIFWFYVAVKIWELWLEAPSGTFNDKLLWIWRNARKAMVVYLLVITGPVLVMAVGGTAIGFARTGRQAVATSAKPIFATLDKLLDHTLGMMNSMGLQLAARAGGRDVVSPTAWQWTKGGLQGAVDGMTLGTNMLIPGVEGGAAQIEGYIAENAGKAARADANNLLRVEQSAKIALDAQKAMIQQAKIRGASKSYIDKLESQAREMRAGVRSAEQTAIYGTNWEQAERKEIWYGLQAAWEAESKTLPIGMAPEEVAKQLAGVSPGGQIYTQFLQQGGWASEGGKAGEFVLSELSKATEAEIANRRSQRGWQDNIPIWGWEVVSILGIGICCVGIILCGVNIFKAAYGAVLYTVTATAGIIFAVSMAGPLSPLFFLCFLSDKTEGFGRNFVNFMLGGLFASMGMMLAAKACGSVFTLLAQSLLAQGAYRISQIIQHTDSMGSFFMACLTSAGAMMVAGMAFTFIADFIKKGAAIGSGIFSGHYPA